MRQNPFHQLRGLCEGAPHEFDGIVANLVRAKYADARRVRVYKGDGGVDTSYGDWGASGSLDVFQAKYFPDPLGDSQKAQIRDSYRTAHENANFRLRRWVLCLPTTLRQEDLTWLDNWKAEQDVHIELWDGDKLEELLELPSASRARNRLKQLGAVGLPEGQAVLQPILHANQDRNTFGTHFHLQLDLMNVGDRSAHDVRLIVRHTESQHMTMEASQPWVRESPVLNPRSLSCPRSINPGETFLVMLIPFGQVPMPVEVRLQVTCRDTPKKEWRASVQESDLDSNSPVAFAEATLTRQEMEPARTGEPEYGPAVEILDKIFENQNPATRGISVILKELPGSQPGHIPFYATTEPSSKGLLSMDRDVLVQALQELVNLGWVKDRGKVGATRVYSLVKERPVSPASA